MERGEGGSVEKDCLLMKVYIYICTHTKLDEIFFSQPINAI